VPMIELQNLVKRFDHNTVVQGLSLDINKGDFITLLGPSGCGKTTTLRMIAGFELPTSGQILLDGEYVHHLPPYKRNVNTVFQNYALFPHLNVFNNVAFGLKVKNVAKSEINEKVKQALKLVQLDEFANRNPDQLSGGQKQRVAIARALVNNPKVLLLDEPLGALDQKLRKQMQVELKHLQKQLGVTFIFVTHDQEEALTMSDRVAVMNNGVLEQVGTPNEIYDHPSTPFVAEFIGETNLIPGIVKAKFADVVTLDFQDFDMKMTTKQSVNINEKILLTIRPERSKLTLFPEDDHRLVHISGRLMERIYCGIFTKTIVMLPGGTPFISHEKTDQLLPLQVGDELIICLNPDHAVVLKQ
jgi:spermidine/putrescine transport system ATP-binding protein